MGEWGPVNAHEGTHRGISTVVLGQQTESASVSSHRTRVLGKDLSGVWISTQHCNKTTTKSPVLGTVLTNKALQSTQINTNQEAGESQAGTHTESHAFVEGGTAADLSYWEHSVVTGKAKC